MSIKLLRTSVHAEENWHDFYRSCVSESKRTAREIPFSTMRHAFVTFACLGYANEAYVPLRRKKELFIAPSLEQEHIPVLAALAYARLKEEGKSHLESIDVVSTSQGLIPVVEGWAQGGAEIFKGLLERGGPLGLDVLLDTVMPVAKKVL